MKNIYLIVGKSGSGKDTIVNALCEKYGYRRLISYTTRPPRNDPNDKKSHIFTTIDDYKQMQKNGDVMAETYYNGNYYWATRKQANNSDLYIIDPDGVWSMRKRYFDKHIVTIYIDAPDKVREQRMKQRGDRRKDIKERLRNDEVDFMPQILRFDERIINNGYAVEDVVGQVQAIIDKYETMATSCKKTAIDAECIDCTRIGVDERGKYCVNVSNDVDKTSILEDIAKAVSGYGKKDMVPVSGGLLYNIQKLLKEQT